MNSQIIFFYIIYWGVIGFLLYKGWIRWAGFVFLFFLAWQPITIGLIIIYAIPKGKAVVGPAFPFLPIIMGGFVLGLAILCPFSGNFFKKAPNSHSRLRWVYFCSGVGIYFVGIFISLMMLYSSKIFGISSPMVMPVSYVMLAMITSSSIIFYLTSRMNSDNYPNLMRIVIFIFMCTPLNILTIISLIMIYALPNKVVYLFPPVLMSVGMLPFALLFIGIAKDYTPISK